MSYEHSLAFLIFKYVDFKMLSTKGDLYPKLFETNKSNFIH